MAQLLSPGVFIEEVAATTQVVGPVSTSTVGIVTWTLQGPTNTATLVTNFDQYVKVFGSFDKRTYGTYAMAAFFTNGGQRAYVVRVTPSDAVAAQAEVQSLVTEQLIETGDGVKTTYTETGATTSVVVNSGASPVVAGSFSIEYRATQTAVTGQIARKRDDLTPMTEATGVLVYEGRVDTKSTLTLGTSNSAISFRSVADARQDITVAIVVSGNNTPLSITAVGSVITINSATDGGGLATSTPNSIVAAWPAAASALVTPTAGGTGAGIVVAAGPTHLIGMPLFDENLDSLVVGTFTIHWTANSVAKSIAFTGADVTTPIATKTNVAGSSVTLDLRSGKFSLVIVAAEAPILADDGTNFTVDYTPASTTIVLTGDTTVNAQGNMGITGSTLSGGGTTTAALTNPPGVSQSYINVNTGAYQLVFTAGPTNIPYNKARVLATYKINAWTFNPISAGTWGNNLSIQIQGSPNYFTSLTQTYTRFTTFILQTDSNGNTAIQETYEDLIYNDPTSAYFFADIINEFSSLVRVVEPGANEAPRQLNGIANSVVLAGGDDSDTTRLIQVTVPGNPIAARSLVITYTDSLGTARTIKDDGQGNLTGDIDPAYVGATANTVNYITGALDFKTVPVAGPLGIKSGTLVVATYETAPAETIHTEAFGDVTKSYTVGTDGTFDTTHYGRSQFTSPTLQPVWQGVYALDRTDELLQVIIPDFAGDITITGDLLDYAAARAASPQGGDRFIILTVPKGSTAQTAVDWFRNKLGRYSNYAALYWPWVNISDPLTNGRKLTMPVLGHIAGIYARTDSTRNVGKSPGGTVDGALSFILSLETSPTQGERDLVYPNKINPLISSPQTGMAVWGVRTIALDTQWMYINARRLFMFLEKSIFNSTFWIVFENNGPALWARIKSQISGFLLGLFNDGYFAGTSPDQAFFVICDNTNNTADTINQGEVVIDIGVAPSKPAEFVRFRFQQKTVG
jgi:phage tail sheath protein FI